MTEEKRIIVSEHGALTCSYPTDNNIPVWEFSKNFSPEPITKSEFKNFVVKSMFGFNKQIIEFIGVDEFWDMYSKPVPEKKWYVKVPHAYNTFYHKWFDSDVLGAQSVHGVNNQLNKLDNSCKFTNKEIKYYGLQDCKKVPVDD